MQALSLCGETKLLARRSKKIIARLKKRDLNRAAAEESHLQYHKEGENIIVPPPRKELPVGAAHNIAKQARCL